MLIILLIVLAVLLLKGGWGYPRHAYGGFSPVEALVLIGVSLFFTGHFQPAPRSPPAPDCHVRHS